MHLIKFNSFILPIFFIIFLSIYIKHLICILRISIVKFIIGSNIPFIHTRPLISICNWIWDKAKNCDQLKLEIGVSIYNMAFLGLHNALLFSLYNVRFIAPIGPLNASKQKKKSYHIFCNIVQLYYLFIINIHMYTWSLKEAGVINLDKNRFDWKNYLILSNKAANLNYLSILILLN